MPSKQKKRRRFFCQNFRYFFEYHHSVAIEMRENRGYLRRENIRKEGKRSLKEASRKPQRGDQAKSLAKKKEPRRVGPPSPHKRAPSVSTVFAVTALSRRGPRCRSLGMPHCLHSGLFPVLNHGCGFQTLHAFVDCRQGDFSFCLASYEELRSFLV